MKRNLLSVVVVGLAAMSVQASNVNVAVQGPNGESEVFVGANGTVSYRVVANLTDGTNEGLALIGLSLNYTGGDIGQQADTPAGAVTCPNPMPAFVIPDGITNPAGFGGTMIGGDLIQVGGAQNTINNDIGNAPFPIGVVITGVAKPGACGQAIIATGSFNRGPTTDTFQLQAFDVFANVIKAGETGAPFWATEAAGVGTVTNLTVSGVVSVPAFVSSVPAATAVGVPTPPAAATIWRTQRSVFRLTFNGTLSAAPTAGQILITQLQPAGAFGADVSANGFTFTLENGPNGTNSVLRIADDLTSDFPHRTWFAVRNTGGWAAAANFEAQFPVQIGDAGANNNVLAADVLTINSRVSCLVNCGGDQVREDINGDNRILSADVLEANSRVSSLPVAKPSGH